MFKSKSSKIVGSASIICILVASSFIISNGVTRNEVLGADSNEAKSVSLIHENINDEMARLENNEISREAINGNIPGKLEVHIDNPPVYSMDEVDAILTNGINAYNQNGKTIIPTEGYTSQFIKHDYDSDSIELKSYIYHMMLNSIDYFNSAEGEMIYAVNTSAPISIIFQTDISKKLSYESESQFGLPVNEFYHSDNMLYCVNCKTEKYTENICAVPLDFLVSDNERVIMLDDGEYMKLNRNDLTNLGISGNSCLFPQSYAMAYLSDFANWELGEITDFLGRTCINVNGKSNEGKFSMIIDIYTGALLKYELYNSSGDVTGFVEANNIKFDSNIDVVEFDKSKYVKEDELTE